MSASADRPYPPLELVRRVCSPDGRADPYEAYERLGAELKRGLVDLLPDGWSFEGKRILDFGCGAGRTLRHFLPEAHDGEFWGTDIDGASIRWLEASLCPPLHVLQCEADPPLGLEHGSFDLAWAISVFTHLTDNSLHWLLELHRLLKPGGLLIASYMGRWNSELFYTGEPWNEDEVGMNVLHHLNSWDSGGPVVLMSDWWIRAHWGRAFEIVRVAPEVHDQSWALLRKRDVELTAADLERPEDDPREYRALRHNLRQVQQELVSDIGRVQQAYEQSLSWRVTRPLREGARTARSLRARRLRRSGGANRGTPSP